MHDVILVLHFGCSNERLGDWAVLEAPADRSKHRRVVRCGHVTAELVQGNYVSLQHCTWLSALLVGTLTHTRTHTPETLLYHPPTSAPPPLLCLIEIGLEPRGTYALTIGDLFSLTCISGAKLSRLLKQILWQHSCYDSRPLVLFWWIFSYNRDTNSPCSGVSSKSDTHTVKAAEL